MNKKSFNVVAALLFDDDGRILITKRPAGAHLAGFWEFPGGTIESGESPQQALVREIKEETALDIEVQKLFWQERFEYDVKIIHIAFYFCVLSYKEQQVVPLQVADFRWAAINELAGFSFPPADGALLKQLAKIKIKQD